MKNYVSMLIKIKNGQLSKKQFLVHKKTKFCESLVKILWKTNLIIGYKINNSKLKIFLKYSNNKPVINYLKIVPNSNNYSFYLSIKQIWTINILNNFSIFTTNKGLKTLNDCKKTKIGGKLLFLFK